MYTSFTISFTDAVGGASSSARVCLCLSLNSERNIYVAHENIIFLPAYLELSNMDPIPKSEAEALERMLFKVALVCTIGTSSCR